MYGSVSQIWFGLKPGSNMVFTKHSFLISTIGTKHWIWVFDSQASEVPATKSSLPAPTIDPRISRGRKITCFISFSTLPWESSQALQFKSLALHNRAYIDPKYYEARIKGEYKNIKCYLLWPGVNVQRNPWPLKSKNTNTAWTQWNALTIQLRFSNGRGSSDPGLATSCNCVFMGPQNAKPDRVETILANLNFVPLRSNKNLESPWLL